MNREETLYLAPYIFSLLLSVGIFFYAWLHRHVRGARAYTWFVAAQTLSIFGFIIELISPHLEIKILWDKFQWLTFSTFTVAYLIFAVQFAEQKFQHPRITWGILIAVPLGFCGLVLTDGFHHLIYANPNLKVAQPFSELIYDFTTTVYIYSLYFYATTLYGIFILLRRAFQPYSLYRWQYVIIAIGFLIPVVCTVFALLGINLTPQRDSTPFTFALENIIVAWGLFRYGLFDILPIARERIVENVTDPIVVLDAKNRVVDVNPAALALLDKRASDVLGHYSDEVFAQWPIIVSELEYLDLEHHEISITKNDDETFFLDLSISTIRNENRQLIGRILVARDITEHKTLENGYRLLSEELDQRVRERTKALQRSEERFSKAFQASPVIVTITQLSNARFLEVNETFEKITGYTRDEVIGKTTLELGVWENAADRDHILSLIHNQEEFKNEEIKFRIKDGSLITCLVSGDLIMLEGEACILATIEDISERKKAEARILRLNRLYATISQINQTIIHVRDKVVLFREICRVATEPGQFRMAWIGLIDPQDGLVKPEIFTGAELGYLTNLEIDIHDTILGRGPTGTTIREGHCIICQDIATDPSMAPWRDNALSRGYRSSAAVPFREQGQVVGALTVYSSETQGFDAEDEDLLEQIGLDISFALDSINAETQRKQAETKLLNQLSFDELMTTLLARFATCSYSEVDDSIEAGLQAIANFLDSDLADLIILSKDKTTWNSSHRWVSPNVQAAMESSRISIPAGKLIWGENKLLNGEAIIINTLDDYPAEASPDRKFSEAQGIQSILTIPVRGLETQILGCIDIVSYSCQIHWSESDIVHLKLIGDAIATLLERKNAEANLAEAYDTTLEGWAKALELRDKETEGHSRRVTETTVAVGRALGIHDEELEHLRRGSILHDIGKMGIADDILRKNGPLTKEERAIVEKHPTTAFNLLKTIPYLDKALDVPYCHHEKWDGSGYPRGLKGEEIPLGARIFAIVDVWDALSSERPYKRAWPQAEVLEYLKSQSGKHFDPHILNLFLEMIEKGAI